VDEAAEKFVLRVLSTLTRRKMLAKGDRLIIAVSGGPDSTALLAVLAEIAPGRQLGIEAAHLNHQLRGEESSRDEGRARELCGRLGIPLHVARHEGASWTANIEEQARSARYAFLLRTAVERGCRWVATGHTLDDRAETTLMRLIRGSGVAGVSGIMPVRPDGVIRPLIDCARTEVLAYLQSRQLTWCEDSMNHDPRFLRARMRHELFPILRTMNPKVLQALGRFADDAADDTAVIDRLTQEALGSRRGADGSLDVSGLRDLPGAIRGHLLRRWLAAQRGHLKGLAHVHLRSVERLATRDDEARQVDLPGAGRVVREQALLRYRVGADASVEPIDRDVVAGEVIELCDGWSLAADLVPAPMRVPPAEMNLWHFWADADEVVGPLRFRNVRRGDRIRPMGTRGHRKLQDVFVDAKIPRSLRWRLPVLETGDTLLWVPAVIRSNDALIGARCRVAWRIAVRTAPVAGAPTLC
jgi:tRNA(Ile)-lysidine synthase